MSKSVSLFKAPDITKYSVALTGAGTKRKNTLLALAKTAKVVITQSEHDTALEIARSLKGFSKEVEKTRKELTDPALAVQRLLKKTADEAVAGIDAETKRIEKLIADFRINQERIRQAAIDEQNRIVQEAQDKIDREARERQAEADDLARKAQEARQAGQNKKADALEAQQLAKELEAEEQPTAVVVRTAPIPAAAPTGGGSLREEVKFEVLDIRALLAAFPQFVTLDVKVRELKAFLSLETTNLNTVPGVRAWKEDRFITR